MKKILPALAIVISLMASCVEETPRAELLEYNIGGKLYSYSGIAERYRDIADNTRQGYDWHIYNNNMYSLSIQAYDTSFEKSIFPFPLFEARLGVELPGGQSKTYHAVAGEFRITGQDMGDVIGDFHFKMRNEADPLDSLMITEGFYRIWLERSDRYFSK